MIGTLLELTSCEILVDIEDDGIKLFMRPAVFITVFLTTTALVGCFISIGFAIISSTLIKFRNPSSYEDTGQGRAQTKSTNPASSS